MKRKVWIVVALCIFAALLPMAHASDCWYKDTYGDHDWEIVGYIHPTCDDYGYDLWVCRQCGASIKTYAENPTGHVLDEVYYDEPTCTQDGYSYNVCVVCGEYLYRDLPATGHKYQDVETLEEATCQKEGTMRTRCLICGKESQREIEKADHVFDEGTILTAATDHSMGRRTHRCTVCGTEESEDYYPDGTLYRGMEKCDEVKELQQMLVDLKFLSGKVDGIFGKMTEQAVKDYQKWANLEVTGVAYPQTRNALGSSWYEKMAPDATPVIIPFAASTEVPLEYPPCCIATVDESGAKQIAYCEQHDAIVQAVTQMLAEAETYAEKDSAWETVHSTWLLELDALYERWKAAVAPEELLNVERDQALFLAMLDSQQDLMKSRGVSRQAMDEKIAAMLMEQCVYVCAAVNAQPAA